MKKTDLRRGLARPKPPAETPADPMDDLMRIDPSEADGKPSEGPKIIPIEQPKGGGGKSD